MKTALSIITMVVGFLISTAFAEPRNPVTLLYVYPAACRVCANLEPDLKALTKDFPISGLYIGEGDAGPMPFEVKRGGPDAASSYGFSGEPLLVVLKDGALKQRIAGAWDIKNALPILRAFQGGALSVSEAVEQGTREKCRVTGWVQSSGEYFKDGAFSLTDRRHTLSIRPWLPLEAAMAPMRKKRPRLMSDVVNKPVVLEGTVAGSGEGLHFIVERELTLD